MALRTLEVGNYGGSIRITHPNSDTAADYEQTTRKDSDTFQWSVNPRHPVKSFSIQFSKSPFAVGTPPLTLNGLPGKPTKREVIKDGHDGDGDTDYPYTVNAQALKAEGVLKP